MNLISGTLDSFIPVALIIWFFSIRKIWNDNFDLPKQFNQVYINDMNMYIYIIIKRIRIRNRYRNQIDVDVLHKFVHTVYMRNAAHQFLGCKQSCSLEKEVVYGVRRTVYSACTRTHTHAHFL